MLLVVCKHWHGFAQVARKEVFLRRYGFTELVQEPRVKCLLETIPSGSIVQRHVVRPGESLAALALRYGVGPVELMRLNNLMAQHLLSHRHFVYVPVPSPDRLRGCSASFEYSPLLCRDLLVALPPPPGSREGSQAGPGGEQGAAETAWAEEEARAPPPPKFNRMLLREMKAHVRRLMRTRQLQAAAAGGGGGSGDGSTAASAAEAAAASAAVDVSSARFYLDESGGNAERAARMFVDDYTWPGGDQRRQGAGARPDWLLPGHGSGTEGEAEPMLDHGRGWGRGARAGEGAAGEVKGERVLMVLAGLFGGCCLGVRSRPGRERRAAGGSAPARLQVRNAAESAGVPA
ncbi:hypothetical protein HYH03_014649 [Edaphochlamys debaryana]|uniref:LysM domain-containing protein n=1 Tax=Edaphochlamys debaryana TaxID=47281 RepID=A0A835XKZ4_9CHLO|nr:hypothetical protein HYH03_014649 [Edaphochlamys debaryana]|eukprot:KAG2486722.1 hypothetical protein HYH03_014649 [Edaphochlamys debaryana]